MKKYLFFLISSFLVFLFSFCGKKGPIQLPLARMPQKVEVFEVSQRAEYITLKWANPRTYVDGNPLEEISEVEIWLLAKDKAVAKAEEEATEEVAEVEPVAEEPVTVTVDAFEKEANLVAMIDKEKFAEYQIKRDQTETTEGQILPELLYSYKLEKDQLSKKLIFSLRVKDRRRFKSPFSDLRTIEPQSLPLPPRNPHVFTHKGRIVVMWNIPEGNIDKSTPPTVAGYNIYRTEVEKEPKRINSALISAKILEDPNFSISGHFLISWLKNYLAQWTKYDDNEFLYGEVYRYFVRASATGGEPFLESGDSEIVEILPKDIFAPAPPSGLETIGGGNVIALSWIAGEEKDLAGYKVWRRFEEDEEFKLLTPQPIRENAYTDAAVEKNRRYYYAITALDESGNESKKSGSVSEILR